MNDKNREQLPQHKTSLNQTPENQLTWSLELNVSNARAIARGAAYEQTRLRDVAAITPRGAAYEQTRLRDVAAITPRGAAYEKPIRDARTVIERVVEVHQCWQKQATLEFPNIIRDRLSVNPFRISTPTQRRTPLLDSPPTTSAGEAYEEISPEIIPAPSPELVPITNHKPVFIVHGHDHAARDTVADFVGNWGFTPTVLDKQPSRSRTIIEKFEQCADEADFAIVLMTPDDVGASRKNRADLKPRARQNVIFELGYFFGLIGRKRVCILYKGNLELPSDIQGVVYVPMDDNGEWKQAIVREMESIGLLVDENEI